MASINSISEDYYFTSDLPVIDVRAVGNVVRLKLYNDDEQDLFAELKAYVYNSHAKIHDLQSVVENYMLQHNISMMVLSIQATDSGAADTETIRVVFSKYHYPDTDVQTFLKNNFLTTAQVKTLYPDMREYLLFAFVSGYDTSSNNKVKLTIRYRTPSGSISQYVYQKSASFYSRDSICYISFDLMDIEDYIPEGEALSVLAEKGNRRMQYFVSRQTPSARFLFRNTFNAVETIAVMGVTKQKTEVSHSTAAIGNSLAFYNTKIEKTFELQTAPLTAAVCKHLESLLFSPKVFCIDERNTDFDYLAGDTDYAREILITDSDYSPSDSDENPNSVKLTWKFAFDKPQII